MKVTLLKKDGRKEVINRVELADLAAAIRNGLIDHAVKKTREVYHLMNPHRLADGQVSTQWEGGVRLPRICFAADYQNRKGEWRMIGYNGLVVLEVNDLQTYEKAVGIRELAKKLPETKLCFLGGSGRSVKIVCKGELYGGGLPEGEEAISQFHLNLYMFISTPSKSLLSTLTGLRSFSTWRTIIVRLLSLNSPNRKAELSFVPFTFRILWVLPTSTS